MKASLLLFAGLLLFCNPLSAEAQSKPKLYPSAKLKGMSVGELNQTISTCENEARSGVGVGNQNATGTAARGAAKGAALGVLGGAITKNNAGRSAGAGAAIGGTAAVLDNAKARRDGSPEYRSYVSACLEEKGLKVVGWE